MGIFNKEKDASEDLPNLKYQEVKPLLKKYGGKIEAYQNFNKVMGDAPIDNFSNKNYFIYFLIFAYLLLALDKGRLFFLSIALLVILNITLKFLAKTALKTYKKDLVQALFLDCGIAAILKPEKYFNKIEFNEFELHAKADEVNGEDYIEGSNENFHFKLSEITAKKKPTPFTSEGIFQGLLFVGTWNKNPLVFKNFKIVRSRKKDTTNASFKQLHDFYDLDGKYLRHTATENLLSGDIKEKLLSIAKKFDYRYDIIFKGGQVFIQIKTTKNFFKTDLQSKLDNEAYSSMVKDVLFFVDVINALDNPSHQIETDANEISTLDLSEKLNLKNKLYR